MKLDTAEVAYDKVVAGAGCSLHRDSVDARLIADLLSLGTKGSIIHDPSEMGGFGEIRGGARGEQCPRSSREHMEESATGIKPLDAAACPG